ncbi:MAG: hypothetical protein JSW47_21540 [Phycisphaerales bacterium]|nr:MAG: hypothetical protein JSW47_21540 [Phycisphaerales bacterium]
MRTKVLSVVLAMAACGFIMNACAFAGQPSGEQSEPGFTFSWFSLVKPLGIATLSVVAVTFLTGLFRRKLRARFLRIHLPLAVAALILGIAHGVLVFILYR